MKLSNKTVLCNLCLEDIDTEEPLQASHYCCNCNKNICHVHLQVHKLKKSTKDHHLQLLLEQNSSSSLYKEHHYCKLHAVYLLEVFCDCNQLICSKCAAFSHKTHNYVDIKDIEKVEQEKVTKLFNDFDLKKDILLQRKKLNEAIIESVNKQSQVVKNEINLQFCELHKELDKKKEMLYLAVDEIVENKIKSLQNENQLLEENVNNIQRLCKLKNNNLNSIDILQNKLKLESEINSLNKVNVLNKPNEMIDFKVNMTNDKNKLIEIIKNNLGNIENKEIKENDLVSNLKLQSNLLLVDFILNKQFNNENNEKCQFNYLTDIVYNNNLIYLSEIKNKRIVILDLSFNYVKEIELKEEPLSLAIINDYLFIGCEKIIYKYNLNNLQLLNEITSKDNQYNFNTVFGMALDNENNIYICNKSNKEIIILNVNNQFLIRKFTIQHNLFPNKILINNQNQIVITCYNNNYSELQIYDKLGNLIRFLKFDYSNLCGIVNDKNDNYILCDYKNDNLIVMDKFNVVKEFNENLNSPIGISFNERNNNIYVIEDYGGNCIKEYI